MIDETTLRMIDDETLEKHIVSEWFDKASVLLDELAKELGAKYQCKIYFYDHEGLYEIDRKVSYYDGEIRRLIKDV